MSDRNALVVVLAICLISFSASIAVGLAYVLAENQPRPYIASYGDVAPFDIEKAEDERDLRLHLPEAEKAIGPSWLWRLAEPVPWRDFLILVIRRTNDGSTWVIVFHKENGAWQLKDVACIFGCPEKDEN